MMEAELNCIFAVDALAAVAPTNAVHTIVTTLSALLWFRRNEGGCEWRHNPRNRLPVYDFTV